MNLTSTQWLEYHVGTISALYNTPDPVNITTDAMSVDGYVLSLTACARDLTKNICELYGTNGYIRTSYTYSPYGQVTATGNVTQPIQWSSEYHDTELGLAYYIYRHYNPLDGRWLGRDRVPQRNLYRYCNNSSVATDYLGLKTFVYTFYSDEDSDMNALINAIEQENARIKKIVSDAVKLFDGYKTKCEKGDILDWLRKNGATIKFNGKPFKGNADEYIRRMQEESIKIENNYLKTTEDVKRIKKRISKKSKKYDEIVIIAHSEPYDYFANRVPNNIIVGETNNNMDVVVSKKYFTRRGYNLITCYMGDSNINTWYLVEARLYDCLENEPNCKVSGVLDFFSPRIIIKPLTKTTY